MGILIDTAKTTFFQCAVNKSAESKLRIQLFFANVSVGNYFCTWRDGMCDHL